MEGPDCLRDIDGHCASVVDPDAGLGYVLAADGVLVAHVAFVAFVVLGLFLVLAGRPLGWSFVRNPWFRVLHLAAIGIVIVQAWLGLRCPLTAWESALRAKAGVTTYDGAFIAHWAQALLYYSAPPWVFAAAYTLFGGLVAFCWVWVRPRPF